MCRLGEFYVGQIIRMNFDIDTNCELCGKSRIDGVHRVKFIGHGQLSTYTMSTYGDVFDFIDSDAVCPNCKKSFTAFIERCEDDRYLESDSYFVGVPVQLTSLIEYSEKGD